MKVESLCQRTLVTIDAAASLADAARLMRQAHVGALVVTTEGGGQHQVVGVLTDRDLVIEGLARDGDPGRLQAGSLASRKLVVVAAEADVAEAVWLAATEVDGPLRRPAGADAVALALRAAS